jgi:menaquinone-dependent protoporphyrinogen oxidase
VKAVKSLRDVNDYDAAVIGSAVRMGQWLPEAVQFVKTNRDALSRIPTAYFLVSSTLREDTPDVRQKVSAYLNPVRQILEPTSIGLFAGKIDYRKLSILDRFMAQTMKEPEGDWRNWEAIHNWTLALEQAFAHRQVAMS